MQITSKFTIAIHIITCIEYFQKDILITSSFLASSIGANPVIIRNVLSALKNAHLVNSSQGKSGITIKKPISEISFYDIYKALDCIERGNLFHFHDSPNPKCPVGRNIYEATIDKLELVQLAMEKEMKKIFVSSVIEDTLKQIAAE